MALSLLQNGATVYVTTRFPKNAIERFQQEPSYSVWEERLHCVCIDFKVPAALHEFCESLANEIPHLDILINNAAQTVRKKPIAYRDLVKKEIVDQREEQENKEEMNKRIVDFQSLATR